MVRFRVSPWMWKIEWKTTKRRRPQVQRVLLATRMAKEPRGRPATDFLQTTKGGVSFTCFMGSP
jgi:hypothetical protein